MTNSMNGYQQIPSNYSGVTINIANPGVNLGGGQGCNPNVYVVPNGMNAYPVSPNMQTNPQQVPQNQLNQGYPAQYYMNNFNNTNNVQPNIPAQQQAENPPVINNQNLTTTEYDSLSKSTGIINDIDKLKAEQKEEEKKNVKTQIVALTDEYIMSLENYLNNPDPEIRLMASKEILIRLDEDRDRYNDPALNALLNKMLQDPDSYVRTYALSALSAELASGNEYTMHLLDKMQKDPKADRNDVLQISKILLQRTSKKEEKFVNQQQSVNSQPSEI